jgi:hypothetical protein
MPSPRTGCWPPSPRSPTRSARVAECLQQAKPNAEDVAQAWPPGRRALPTLTITTTAATSAALAYPKRPGAPWYAAGGATLACILLFGIPARRRSWRTMLGMLMFLVALTGGVLACGGGGGSGGGGGGTSNPGTTAGTYTVTVTGTSGTTTATGTVTLNVQ